MVKKRTLCHYTDWSSRPSGSGIQISRMIMHLKQNASTRSMPPACKVAFHALSARACLLLNCTSATARVQTAPRKGLQLFCSAVRLLRTHNECALAGWTQTLLRLLPALPPAICKARAQTALCRNVTSSPSRGSRDVLRHPQMDITIHTRKLENGVPWLGIRVPEAPCPDYASAEPRSDKSTTSVCETSCSRKKSYQYQIILHLASDRFLLVTEEFRNFARVLDDPPYKRPPVNGALHT